MTPQKTIGALLFEGFELLDVFGPLEAWGMLAAAGKWRIVTVAESAGAVKSAQGPQAVAEFSLTDCPKLDVILVPGGMGTRRAVTNDQLLGWLRARAVEAEVTSSVCTGSSLLARAGLLDGRLATTNKASFAWVTTQGPAVEWVKQARWVVDGTFATSSGVSAGIDMTLAVIATLEGQDEADRIAVRMEYDWHRDATWDPFAEVHGLVGDAHFRTR
jgi:transcriptional regulator GlxA family with amidase domain